MFDTTEALSELEKMDSSFNFGSALKTEGVDLSQVKNARLLDRVTMTMHSDEAQQEMTISLNVDFDNIEQLDDIMMAMEEAGQQEAAAGSENGGNMERAASFLTKGGLGFSYKKGTLTREAQSLDDGLAAEEVDPSELQMMQSMFGSMTYSTIIHLPGKVKKISMDNAKLVDQKTIRIDYDLSELMESSVLPGYEIKFKNK